MRSARLTRPRPTPPHRPRARLARPVAAAVVVAAIAVAAAGCGSSGEPSAPSGQAERTSEVTAKNLRYNPAKIQVPPGTTVTWRFDDNGVPHDVVGDGFRSERMDGGRFTHKFTEAGTYPYKCTLHPGMTGEVIVAS